MSKLMTIQAWLECNYMPGSEPDRETVIHWIESGQLAGERQGADYFIPEGAVFVSPAARAGEDEVACLRSGRLVRKGVPWYFLTRDGEDDRGPFDNEEQAREALRHFVAQMKEKGRGA